MPSPEPRPTPDMTARRSSLEVSLEEDLPGVGENPPRRLRLAVTLHAPEGQEPSEADVTEATELLRTRLATARQAVAAQEGGGVPGPRPDRSLVDLIELYRPKSQDLVDALLWEGDLTPTEHTALTKHVRTLGGTPSSEAPPPRRAAPVPPAALPTSPTRNVPTARGTEELIAKYKLESLQDVNRARAQRAISYDEWFALKKYFVDRHQAPVSPSTPRPQA